MGPSPTPSPSCSHKRLPPHKQNDLSELWSLLNFLLPEIFDDLSSFESWFDMSLVTEADGQAEIVRAEKENSVLATLHSILEPFLLRRLKGDVKLDIPPKREVWEIV